MLVELTAEERVTLRPLFGSWDGRLHGCVEAVFSGEFGRTWADDAASPSVCVANVDFWFVAGDASAGAASAVVGMAPAGGTIVTDGSAAWDAVVRRVFGERVRAETRRSVLTPAADAWDRDGLRAMALDVPVGFEVRRVSAGDVASFAAVEPDLVKNFGSAERFVEQGVGFGAWHEGRYVAGASSFTLANGKLEIEIDTLPEFRRRGLARAVGSALVLHCLERGIEPCWDAYNTESAALAEQIGFVGAREYVVWRVVGE